MRYGFVMPFGDALAAAELAQLAEQAGWDAFFVYEMIWGVDAWVSLTAAAMRTERIRLGTMLTPLPWREPWKLASETATLDRLSGGRLILAVGLGAVDTGTGAFGLPTDRRRRAELLDEGLEVLTGLWSGQPFGFQGQHYHLTPAPRPAPTPAQRPRIPIWVVGAWPRERSMRRALRYDGVLPNVMGDAGMRAPTVEDVRAMSAFVAARRSESTPYDIVVEGTTPGDDPARAAATTRPWAEAGATWWIEGPWQWADDREAVRRRIEQGPPRG